MNVQLLTQTRVGEEPETVYVHMNEAGGSSPGNSPCFPDDASNRPMREKEIAAAIAFPANQEAT